MKTDTDTSTYIPKHASRSMLGINSQLILANLLLDCKSIKLGTNPYTKMKDTKEILETCLAECIVLFCNGEDDPDIKRKRAITTMIWMSTDLYVEMVIRLSETSSENIANESSNENIANESSNENIANEYSNENIANEYSKIVEKMIYYILKNIHYRSADVATFDSGRESFIADILMASIDDDGSNYDKTWLNNVITKYR